MTDVITLSVNLSAGGQHAATAALLKKFASVLAGAGDGAEAGVAGPATVEARIPDDMTTAPEAKPRGRGRPPGATNKTKPAAKDDDGGDETSVIDVGASRRGATADDGGEEAADDGLGFDDDLGDDGEEPAALTLEADIIPAFQKYAKATSREKAAQVLAKFKVKSVRDLPEASFEKVLAALQAGKK